jgi:hypothetical protein
MHNHDTNVPSYAALYAGQNADIIPVKDIRKLYILHPITLLNDVIDDPQILTYIFTLTYSRQATLIPWKRIRQS